MKEYSAEIKDIKFSSVDNVAAHLTKLKITPKNYGDILADAFSASPYKSKMIAKGLLKNSTKFNDRNNVLTAVRVNKDPGVRLEVVRAFKETKNQMDFVTGISLMTKKDATLFFKDYFEVGGNLKDVTQWLANISEIYVQKKRQNNIDPNYDGFWDDLWDAVVDAGKTIGEAITTVVDAVVDAGKAMAEVMGDILAYAQNTINNIIEAFIDAGKEVWDIIQSTIDTMREAARDAMKKIFKAILSAGKTIYDIMKALYEKVTDFIKDGIETLVAIGCRIKKLLSSAWNLSVNILKDVVGFLIDMGKSVWYILRWAKNLTYDVLKTVFEKLIDIGMEIADLVAWCVRRTFDMMVRGFKILLALGKTVGVIVKSLLTDPRNVFSDGLNVLMELGGTIHDFFEAAYELGKDFVQRVYLSLKELGMDLVYILKYAAEKGYEVFKAIVIMLLEAGIKGFNILVWAIQTSVEVFGWLLEAFDAVFESLADIVEWVFSLGGDWMKELARWLADKARTAIDWIKDKVILPLLSIGKLFLVIALASYYIVFLAIAIVVLKSLVDDSKTDYKHWPLEFEQFKSLFASKMAVLPDVDASHKYVIVSDVHKESSDDIEAGIGHFYKNKALFAKVLRHYSNDASWTVVSVGDDEEFWYSDDLDTESNPMNKIQPIVNNNSDIYDILSEDYYKNRTPRRFVKIRGNHDDVWKKSAAVNKLEANGFPELNIYDYGLIRRNGKDILLMHGHQFDPYNCDANSFFGKFCSNFVGESIDQLNDTITSIFGESARIEGWSLAPFFRKDEWLEMLGSVETSKISSGLMFDENLIVDKIRQYDCSMIIGHTHDPKIMKDSQAEGRYYINSGTSGWWEGIVWVIEITTEDIILKGWVEDDTTEASYAYPLAAASVF